jgi:hypothetical protein
MYGPFHTAASLTWMQTPRLRSGGLVNKPLVPSQEMRLLTLEFERRLENAHAILTRA